MDNTNKCHFYQCIGKDCHLDHIHEHTVAGIKSDCKEIDCMPCDHCCGKANIYDSLCKKCFDKETDKEEKQFSLRDYYRRKYKE